MAESEVQQNSGKYESEADIAKGKAGFVRRWLEAIELSSDEEKEWRKTGEEARKVYEAAKDAPTGTAFNLYYANIETICPSLYNSSPIPDIRRRFNDKDPVAKEGADTIERVLSYSLDEYEFDEPVGEAIFDLATTGRGVAEVVYDGQEDPDSPTGIGAQTVECAATPWASFRRGPARAWSEVPWVAFAHYMTREALVALSPQYGKDVKLNLRVSRENSETKDEAQQDTPEGDIFKRALVWKIWDKDKRVVRFIAPSFPDDQLAEIPDPYNLKQFFPCPRPMMTGKASGRLVPLAPYKIYKPIIREIDDISKRITKLIKTLRPRALGVGSVDQDAWAAADDGQIVEVSDVMGFLQSGGLSKLLDWFPLDPVVKAVQELYTRREQAKMELYEVSGLADVMRGQSNPSETLGAQDIKQRWGSLRLQKAQQEVQRFCRDLFRLKAEIIAEKFTPENLAVMTGQNMEQPAPPQSQDPAALQQYQQAVQAYQKQRQQWAATIKLIKDDKMRGYRIDVETDSTIRGDLTRNQEAMAQFVQGTAQYFTAVAPIVEAGAVSMTAVVAIYSAFARNFKLGKEVDATLDQLAEQAAQAEQQKAQQGPPPNPEMEKVKAQIEGDKAKLQLEAQKAQQDGQIKQQQQQTDIQAKQAEQASNVQAMREEMALKREIAIMEFNLKKELAYAELALKAQTNMQDQQIKARDSQANTQIKAQESQAKQKEQANGKAEKTQGDAQLAKHLTEMGKAIAEMSKAIVAPRTVTTPDGRKYTSKAN